MDGLDLLALYLKKAIFFLSFFFFNDGMSLDFLQKFAGTSLVGRPAVRTWCSHCGDPRFDPWLGSCRLGVEVKMHT